MQLDDADMQLDDDLTSTNISGNINTDPFEVQINPDYAAFKGHITTEFTRTQPNNDGDPADIRLGGDLARSGTRSGKKYKFYGIQPTLPKNKQTESNRSRRDEKLRRGDKLGRSDKPRKNHELRITNGPIISNEPNINGLKTSSRLKLSNENIESIERKRKAANSDTDSDEKGANGHSRLNILRKKLIRRPKKKLKFWEDFDLTRKVISSASTWPSLIALVNELRTAMEYLAIGKYEKYHLSMISLILRACPCTLEELNDIQMNLPGTLKTISVPIFKHVVKVGNDKTIFRDTENNTVENTRKDFSRVIYVDFPIDGGRKAQKHCIELLHSVLQQNHPVLRDEAEEPQGFPSLEDESVDMSHIYNEINTTERIEKYRQVMSSFEFDKDKEWLYDLQWKITNRVLQQLTALQQKAVSMLNDQSLDFQTSANMKGETKKPMEFDSGSESKLELNDNVSLLFESLERSHLERRQKLEELEKLERDLEERRSEMEKSLQDERKEMKKHIEEALKRVIEDVQLGTAEADQMRLGESDLFVAEDIMEDITEGITPITFAWTESMDALNGKILEIQTENKKLNTEAEKAKGRETELSACVDDLEKEKAILVNKLKEREITMRKKEDVESQEKKIIEEVVLSLERALNDGMGENQPIALSQKGTEEEMEGVPQYLSKVHDTVSKYQESMHELANLKQRSQEWDRLVITLNEKIDGMKKSNSSLNGHLPETRATAHANLQDIEKLKAERNALESSHERLKSALESKEVEYTHLQEGYRRQLEMRDHDLQKRKEVFLNLKEMFENLNLKDSQKESRLSELLNNARGSLVQRTEYREVTSNSLTIASAAMGVPIQVEKIDATESEVVDCLKAMSQYYEQYEAKRQQLVQANIKEGLDAIRAVIDIASTQGPETLQELKREMKGMYSYQRIRDQINTLSQESRARQTRSAQKKQILYNFGDWMIENEAKPAHPRLCNSEQLKRLLTHLTNQWEKVDSTGESDPQPSERRDEPKSEAYHIDRLFVAITSLIDQSRISVANMDELQSSSDSLEGLLTSLQDTVKGWSENDYIDLLTSDEERWKATFDTYCRTSHKILKKHEGLFISLCQSTKVLVQSRNNLRSILKRLANHQWETNHKGVKADLALFTKTLTNIDDTLCSPDERRTILENINYLQVIWPSNGLLNIDKTVILPRRQFDEAQKHSGRVEAAAAWIALAKQLRRINQLIYGTGEDGPDCKSTGDLPWKEEDPIHTKINKIEIFFQQLENRFNSVSGEDRLRVPPNYNMDDNMRSPKPASESGEVNMEGDGSVHPDNQERTTGGGDARGRAAAQTKDEDSDKPASPQIEKTTQINLISKMEKVLQELREAKDIFVFKSTWSEELLRTHQASLTETLPQLNLFSSRLEHITTTFRQSSEQLSHFPSESIHKYDTLLARVDQSIEHKKQIEVVCNGIGSCIEINSSLEKLLKRDIDQINILRSGAACNPETIQQFIESKKYQQEAVNRMLEDLNGKEPEQAPLAILSIISSLHNLTQGTLRNYMTSFEYSQHYVECLQGLQDQQSKQKEDELSRLRILNIWADWLTSTCGGSADGRLKRDISDLLEEVERNCNIEEELLKIENSIAPLEGGTPIQSFLDSIRNNSAHTPHTQYPQVYRELFKIILSVSIAHSVTQEKIIYLEKEAQLHQELQTNSPKPNINIPNTPAQQLKESDIAMEKDIPDAANSRIEEVQIEGEVPDSYTNSMTETGKGDKSQNVSAQLEFPFSSDSIDVGEMNINDPLTHIFAAFKKGLASFVQDTGADTSTEGLCYGALVSFLQSIGKQYTNQQSSQSVRPRREEGHHESSDANQRICHNLTIKGEQYKIIAAFSHRKERFVLIQIGANYQHDQWKGQKYGSVKYQVLQLASIFVGRDYQLMEDNAQALYEFYLSDQSPGMIDIPDSVLFESLSKMNKSSKGCSFSVRFRGEKHERRCAASKIRNWGDHAIIAMNKAIKNERWEA
jgi:hypothetical protein